MIKTELTLCETIDGYELREEVSSYSAFSGPEKSNIDRLNTFEWDTLIFISGDYHSPYKKRRCLHPARWPHRVHQPHPLHPPVYPARILRTRGETVRKAVNKDRSRNKKYKKRCLRRRGEPLRIRL